jgi:hypothetical protein
MASIATSAQKQEKLAQDFTRNQFSICAEGVPDSVLSLRECAKKLSLAGGQGYQTCVCVKVNASQISVSVNNGNLCNSKCHGSLQKYSSNLK